MSRSARTRRRRVESHGRIGRPRSIEGRAPGGSAATNVPREGYASRDGVASREPSRAYGIQLYSVWTWAIILARNKRLRADESKATSDLPAGVDRGANDREPGPRARRGSRR